MSKANNRYSRVSKAKHLKGIIGKFTSVAKSNKNAVNLENKVYPELDDLEEIINDSNSLDLEDEIYSILEDMHLDDSNIYEEYKKINISSYRTIPEDLANCKIIPMEELTINNEPGFGELYVELKGGEIHYKLLSNKNNEIIDGVIKSSDKDIGDLQISDELDLSNTSFKKKLLSITAKREHISKRKPLIMPMYDNYKKKFEIEFQEKLIINNEIEKDNQDNVNYNDNNKVKYR